MKPQEILLASALIALVGGVGAALATRAFLTSSERTAPALREAAPAADSPAPAGESLELEELRSSQTALLQRLVAIEARLGELASARTAAEPLPVSAAPELTERAGERHLEPGEAQELSPDFMASVEAALTRIQDAEEAEREKTRKELQAQRIEERVARLQRELGLTHGQAKDVRTALITQDEKREALFSSLRDGAGDPGSARESFRTLRDETHAELQRILTPEQYAAFQASEESEFGRRGFGDFGPPPGGRPGEGGFGRPR